MERLFWSIKVMPIAKFTKSENAFKVCEILLDNGINGVEITMRNKNAVPILKKIRKNFPDMILGVGTALTKAHIYAALEADAHFAMAPGLDPTILQLARSYDLPFFPGISTPSELITAIRQGCDMVKFFPAEVMGGPKFLQAIEPVFAHTDIKFIPSGGITPDNVEGYLKMDRVLFCGMTYHVDAELINSKNWTEIEKRIKQVYSIANKYEKKKIEISKEIIKQ